MRQTQIGSGWTVRPTTLVDYPRPQHKPIWPIPASVPGHIHLDLQRAGIIPDPFASNFEAGLSWIDETDWTYETTFEWHADEALPRQVLRFGGLDTVCNIFLNGEILASSDNFFVPLEIDVTGLLKPTNELEVRFRSAVKVGEERRRAYFEAQGIPWETNLFDERAFVRKPAYMSGWDWGPRLVSCGIWQPVELIEFRSRIISFTVHQELNAPLQEGNDGRFRLRAEYEIEGDELPTIIYNGQPVGGKEWTVEAPLWWPKGEGEQNLQTIEISLPSGAKWVKRIGLRTIELRREPDQFGTSFEFVVNGRAIWARGANWIPNDSFPSRTSCEAAIHRYQALGMNMLRVWGGGLYESEDFYDACDAAGILVWQDFPYACSYYPDDADAQQAADHEARANISRLRDRTSLALWCGNNEIRSLHYGKWSTNPPARFHGEAIYDKVLKKAVEDLDRSRPYVESSPLVVKVMGGPENPTRHSDDHFWEVWHGKGDWVHYRDSDTRFSSEFGFASSCSMYAWKQVQPGLLSPEDTLVRAHDKTGKPWQVFKDMVELHYPAASTLKDWVYTSQLNQRDAMRFAIEHYRSSPACRGALIWQANDCWPVQSWSLEDYSRLLKPAGFELRRLYAPILICAVLEGDQVKVTVVNDSQNDLTDELEVLGLTFGGEIETRQSIAVQVVPGERITCSCSPRSQVVSCRLISGIAEPRWLMTGEPKNCAIRACDLVIRRVGNQLEAVANGLVLDLIVWNEEDPHVLEDAGLAGFRAVSGLSPSLRFGISGVLGTIRARSLAGEHRVIGMNWDTAVTS